MAVYKFSSLEVSGDVILLRKWLKTSRVTLFYVMVYATWSLCGSTSPVSSDWIFNILGKIKQPPLLMSFEVVEIEESVLVF